METAADKASHEVEVNEDTVVHARCVELFKNERYAPFRGFCSQGLLPTDRKALSTDDGSVR
jgi:hypothetical protein